MGLRGHLGSRKHLRARESWHRQVDKLHAGSWLQSPGQASRAGGSLFARSRSNRLVARRTAWGGRVGQAQIHTTHRRDRRHRLGVDGIQLWGQPRKDCSPALALAGWGATGTGSQLENQVSPSLKSRLGDVQTPANCLEKHQLILVNFQCVQA